MHTTYGIIYYKLSTLYISPNSFFCLFDVLLVVVVDTKLNWSRMFQKKKKTAKRKNIVFVLTFLIHWMTSRPLKWWYAIIITTTINIILTAEFITFQITKMNVFIMTLFFFVHCNHFDLIKFWKNALYFFYCLMICGWKF